MMSKLMMCHLLLLPTYESVIKQQIKWIFICIFTFLQVDLYPLATLPVGKVGEAGHNGQGAPGCRGGAGCPGWRSGRGSLQGAGPRLGLHWWRVYGSHLLGPGVCVPRSPCFDFGVQFGVLLGFWLGAGFTTHQHRTLRFCIGVF